MFALDPVALLTLYLNGGTAGVSPVPSPTVTIDPAALLWMTLRGGAAAPIIVPPVLPGLFFYVDIIQSGGRA